LSLRYPTDNEAITQQQTVIYDVLVRAMPHKLGSSSQCNGLVLPHDGNPQTLTIRSSPLTLSVYAPPKQETIALTGMMIAILLIHCSKSPRGSLPPD
jgi:hypothetical protein